MSDALLEVMLSTAQEASELVRTIYAREFLVEYKSPGDPVTEADRSANALILERLQRAFPDIPVVAEESPEQAYADFRGAERVFFVDPVDGTREFVARNGEFVVMIGLVQGERATHGVIASPTQRIAWAGAVGQGAFASSDDERTPIRVSDNAELGGARIVASRSRRSPRLAQTARAFARATVTALGSAGLKAASVATGQADLYVALNNAGKRWDACACDALVTAAGGTFSDQFGAPIAYRAASLLNDRGIVATTPALHEAVLERLRETAPERDKRG